MNRGELYDATTGAKLYTVREASRVLGYHPFSVYRLVWLGKLRHRRLGPKTLLFSREDLLRYQEGLAKARRGKPLPRQDSDEPQLTARVAVDLGRGAIAPRHAGKEGSPAGGGGAGGRWQVFRWESVPLIRARMDSQYGERLKGLQISVRGREGEAWRVIYQKP